MPINDWPPQERPREKLLHRGAASLSDAELLAIFLRTGVRGLSAVDLARQCLQGFGSLQQLFEAPAARFCEQRGLGEAKYVLLQATLELSRRYFSEQLTQRDVFSSPADTRRYLFSQLRQYPHEVFAVLFLDNRHRLIAFEKLFHGTIDGAQVHPREVLRRTLAHNAAAVILAHNHPSGVAEPSRADEQITQRLQQALALIEVRVLDHMVIGDEVVSFAERGLL